MLMGGEGDDSLNGGAGADTMFGGIGNNNYTVDDAGDIAKGGGGTDSVFSSIDYTLNSSLDNLFLLSAPTALEATGNASDNDSWN